MEIAKGIDAEDWKKLDLSRPENPDWEHGIFILERRLQGRFTGPLEFLIKDDQEKGPLDRRFGFVILGVDCMLVETLQAFREGLTNTRSKAKELCTTFLTTRPSFKEFFTKELATRFYYEFRCGLVHNAQVFGTGKIWSVGALLQLDRSQNPVQMTINRTEFHRAVTLEIQAYLDELRDRSAKELRERFRTKMDFVAEGKFID